MGGRKCRDVPANKPCCDSHTLSDPTNMQYSHLRRPSVRVVQHSRGTKGYPSGGAGRGGGGGGCDLTPTHSHRAWAALQPPGHRARGEEATWCWQGCRTDTCSRNHSTAAHRRGAATGRPAQPRAVHVIGCVRGMLDVEGPMPSRGREVGGGRWGKAVEGRVSG